MDGWLQLPTDACGGRRHSGGCVPSVGGVDPALSVPRRRSLQPTGSSPAAVVGGAGDCEATPGFGRDPSPAAGGSGACRRRSFSVTPKGDVVNEGDEILPRQGVLLTTHSHTFNFPLYPSNHRHCASKISTDEGSCVGGRDSRRGDGSGVRPNAPRSVAPGQMPLFTE